MPLKNSNDTIGNRTRDLHCFYIFSAMISKFTPCTNISLNNNSAMHCMISDDNLKEMQSGRLIQYSHSLRGGRSGDRISGGDGIFRARLGRPWGIPSLLCKGYRVSVGVEAARRGAAHPPSFRGCECVGGGSSLKACRSRGRAAPRWSSTSTSPICLHWRVLG
jgi:hypothetical protein